MLHAINRLYGMQLKTNFNIKPNLKTKFLLKWMTKAKTPAVATIFEELPRLHYQFKDADFNYLFTSVNIGADTEFIIREWDTVIPRLLRNPEVLIYVLQTMINNLHKNIKNRPEINFPFIQQLDDKMRTLPINIQQSIPWNSVISAFASKLNAESD